MFRTESSTVYWYSRASCNVAPQYYLSPCITVEAGLMLWYVSIPSFFFVSQKPFKGGHDMMRKETLYRCDWSLFSSGCFHLSSRSPGPYSPPQPAVKWLLLEGAKYPDRNFLLAPNHPSIHPLYCSAGGFLPRTKRGSLSTFFVGRGKWEGAGKGGFPVKRYPT